VQNGSVLLGLADGTDLPMSQVSGITEAAATPATATPAETVRPSAPVRIPARTVPMPRWVYVIAGLAALGLLLAIGDCIAGHSGGKKEPAHFNPLAGPSRADPNEPRTFAAPPFRDGKAAKDWGKIAEKINHGDLDEALHKLRDFERKHGESAESIELRDWLESQTSDRYDDEY
jgi:hypothetical protein